MRACEKVRKSIKPGTGETPVAPVYVDGERVKTLKGDGIATEFQAIVEQYVKDKYGQTV